MGFNVDSTSNKVTVDHSHNNYAVTTVAGNPIVKMFSTIEVTSIFARTKGKRQRTDPGDNSPMLYALKGIGDLTTTYSSVATLYLNYREIMASVVLHKEPQGLWDCVVPMPSSSKLSSLMAKTIVRHAGVGPVQPSLLKKVTGDAVLASLDGLAMSSKDKTALRTEVRRFIKFNGGETDFQMKSIKRVDLRCHLCPFMLGSEPLQHQPNRILLVDDMVTSGTSIVSAAALLSTHYPQARIEAVTLFGSSR